MKKKIKRRSKAQPDLRLLNSKVLMAVMAYLDEEIDDFVVGNMKRILVDHRDYKDEVKKEFKGVFHFLRNDRVTGEPATKVQIDKVKKAVNELAKKVWKK